MAGDVARGGLDGDRPTVRGAGTRDPRDPGPRWWRPGLGDDCWGWVPVLVAVGFAVATVAALRSSWSVTSDAAIFLTRVLDAPGDPPLVGVYSRFGWYHPGPALAWWFLLPSWVSGGAPAVALAAGMVLKGAAAVAATVLAGRRAGLAGAALAAVVASVLLVTMPDTPYTIWNPTVVVLVFLCVVVSAWSLAVGDRWAPAVLVVSGSICAQAHVGYLPLVVAVAAFATLVVVVVERRGAAPGPGWRVPLSVAAALGAALWAPVVIDQVTGTGNLGALVEYFVGGDDPTLGMADALGLVARSYVPWGPWAGGPEPIGLLGDLRGAPWWWVVLPAGALAASGLFAWWRRDRVVAALAAVVAVAAVAGLVTLASLSDVAYPYLYPWSRVVGAMVWFTVALVLVRAVVVLRPGWAGAARGAAAGAAVVAVVVAVAVVPGADRPEPVLSDAVAGLLPAAEAVTRPGQTVAMTFTEPFPGVAEGLVYELERLDRRVTVPFDAEFTWSGTRGGDPDSADEHLAVATGDAIAGFAADPGWEEVARFDPLGPAERAEYERLQASLEARLEATAPAGVADFLDSAPQLFVDDPNLDSGDLARFVELHPRRQVFVLYRAR
ncbi:MAG: hypothetical protein MUE36_11125 [Acidimicrobiales bacterium]|nr:hypothetical protein [Acidimicrobiales bacterium]